MSSLRHGSRPRSSLFGSITAVNQAKVDQASVDQASVDQAGLEPALCRVWTGRSRR